MPLALVAGVFAFLWIFFSDRLAMCADEGIYLEGARRMLAGEIPYRDFFALTGPGSFWWQAIAFQLSGVNYQAGRIIVLLDVAILAGCICALTTRFANRAAGVLAALFFLAVPLTDAALLSSNHRWDSSALAVLALVVLLELPRTRWSAALAGMLAAAAAWTTPTVALAGAVLGAWLLAVPGRLKQAVPFAAAVLGVSSAAALWLASHGALLPMVRDLSWTASNYSAANRFAYGGIIGGYGNLFAGASGAEWPVRFVIVLLLVLPAILPVAAILGWAYLLRKERHPDLAAVLCFTGAFVLTTWPRMDVQHLYYVFAPSCALGAALLARVRLPPLRLAVFGAASFIVAVFGWYSLSTTLHAPSIETPAGRLRGAPEQLDAVRLLNSSVAPGDTLFVYPYAPLLYFLSGARNPTRFNYLQPGMMTDSDESLALSELRAAPPSTVLYAAVTPAEYLRIWPSSDPSRLRMHRIEAFFDSCYSTRADSPSAPMPFRILAWRGCPVDTPTAPTIVEIP